MVIFNVVKRKNLILASLWYYFNERNMNVELIGAVLFLSLYSYTKESRGGFSMNFRRYARLGNKFVT